MASVTPESFAAYLRSQGYSDADIQQILGGSKPPQPTQAKPNPLTQGLGLAGLANKAGLFGDYGGSGVGAGISGVSQGIGILNSNASPEDKANALKLTAENSIASYYSGGISDLALAADKKLFGGKIESLREKIESKDPISKIGTSILSKGLGLFDHKSTKKYEQEGTDSALALSPDDPKWQDFVMKARASAHSDLYPDVQIGVNPPAHEGVTADDRMFSLGNLQTFGPDWMNKYNVDQERNISQALLDNDLYSSSKGDVHVTNQDLARQLAQQVIGGTYKYKSGSAPVAPDYAATQTPQKTTGMSNLAPLAVSQTDPSLIAKSIADEQIAAQAQAQNMQSASDKKTRLMGMANLSSIAPLPIARLDTSNLLKNKYA